MATLEKALQIAAAAHAGQTDKRGLPYILHPLDVMRGVDSDEARIVAVLHDVVEDTPVTLDDLRAAGFSEAVLAAVALVTHAAGESYADYVVRLEPNPVARAVKLADLRDNTRIDRNVLRPNRLEADADRWLKYALTYQYLTGRMDEADYRRLLAGRE